jgi:hypothetical protein
VLGDAIMRPQSAVLVRTKVPNWRVTYRINNLCEEFIHVRIEDKDEKGEGYLVIESKEDLEEFWKMLIEAYYELNPDRKRPCEAQSPK